MSAGAGKELHLNAVLDDMAAANEIQPEQILLIDDDEENIAIARRHQHRVYHVRGAEVSMQDIDEYVSSLEKEVRTQHAWSANRNAAIASVHANQPIATQL